MTYRVLTVCTGNICRSPMAERLLRSEVTKAGLEDRVQVGSAGTTSWEDGEPIDPRAVAVLAAHGIAATGHRAHQATRAELADADLILALDHDHVRSLARMAPQAQGRTHLVREFDPAAGEDLGIRDPWYGEDADFTETWDLLSAAMPGILAHVREGLGAASTSGTAH